MNNAFEARCDDLHSAISRLDPKLPSLATIRLHAATISHH